MKNLIKVLIIIVSLHSFGQKKCYMEEVILEEYLVVDQYDRLYIKTDFKLKPVCFVLVEPSSKKEVIYLKDGFASNQNKVMFDTRPNNEWVVDAQEVQHQQRSIYYYPEFRNEPRLIDRWRRQWRNTRFRDYSNRANASFAFGGGTQYFYENRRIGDVPLGVIIGNFFR